MLRLELTAPFDRVFVTISLTNPSNGKRCTIDAKVDTGAEVTTIPTEMVSGLELASLGEFYLAMADGTPLRTNACMCRISISDEDEIDMPIYVCDSSAGIALLGMDLLQLCNFSQWHEWEVNGEHHVHFDMELLGEEALIH